MAVRYFQPCATPYRIFKKMYGISNSISPWVSLSGNESFWTYQGCLSIVNRRIVSSTQLWYFCRRRRYWEELGPGWEAIWARMGSDGFSCCNDRRNRYANINKGERWTLNGYSLDLLTLLIVFHIMLAFLWLYPQRWAGKIVGWINLFVYEALVIADARGLWGLCY